jgi:hypothetical protein
LIGLHFEASKPHFISQIFLNSQTVLQTLSFIWVKIFMPVMPPYLRVSCPRIIFFFFSSHPQPATVIIITRYVAIHSKCHARCPRCRKRWVGFPGQAFREERCLNARLRLDQQPQSSTRWPASTLASTGPSKCFGTAMVR